MLTIHAAAEQIRQGKLSPIELLESCLERIDRLESKVHAWVLVDRERARAEAEERTAELKGGHWRGPLHGIPIGIKDIIDVFDWPTACGSKLWANSIAREDATVVRKLREAGAVLIGKTVTTQYASFDPPPTRNPWKLDRTPGGSSSGSAAAVATGMCIAALGTQTGGSICRPAAFCGVVGLKPSQFRVKSWGILPLAWSMDHPGTITRCVRDAAIMLEALVGDDPPDPEYASSPHPNYTALIDNLPDPLSFDRLRGIFETRAEPATLRHFDDVCAKLKKSLGPAIINEVSLPAIFADVEQRHRVVMAVEAAAYHKYRFRRHPEDYGPNITKLLNEGLSCPGPEFAETKRHQERLESEIRQNFDRGDVLLTPTTPGPAPDAATTGDPVFNSPWSYTGLPSICIPTGLNDEGLPLSIQLIGRDFGEADLLAVALWCETALDVDLGEPPLQS